ncbi:hypothetical protein [Inhella gelatinilytica]|uniref:Uncharacterized protein n=1 Tax=Inhella gelatinilytica TaxID=2795030 RepID=A0A931IUK2_9BURK|nr:hypothetical protein [Inhella gelatinilytica]MBH9553057.1 hypothetical protein [Inhella gelatinilytica]
MSEPISSQPFRMLAASLRASGFPAHGARLEAVLDGVWTTSTELLGELGQVVLAVRRDCRPLTAPQQDWVQQCLREVRKAWPGFGWWR